MGDGIKRVEDNERETVVLQRRSLRLAVDKRPGDIVVAEDLESLRPAPPGALEPFRICEVVGQRLRRAIARGENLMPDDLEGQ